MSLKQSLKRFCSLFVAVFATLTLPSLAQAYVNPGAGMTFLGALLGFLAFFLFVVIGIFLWPVRRYLQYRREKQQAAQELAQGKTPDSDQSPDQPA